MSEIGATAPQHNTPFGSWWRTPKGQRCHSYIEAWADVERERHLTGDPCAIPSPEGCGEARGKPSNMPDVLLKHMDVDKRLAGKPELKRLLLFIYRDQVEWREDDFSGRFTKHYDQLRLERFELQDEMASVCRAYGIGPSWLLMSIVTRFGRRLAEELGL